MRGVRPSGLPSVWGLSNFAETNVRTYVRTRDGQPGVWFFSLDAANLVGTALGRWWFRLPYFFARMAVEVSEGADGGIALSYRSRRLLPGSPAARTRIRAEVAGPVRPAQVGSLEYFLAERYLLYAAGRPPKATRPATSGLLRGRVYHTAYPLQEARLVDLDESALAAAGIKRPDKAPLVHYARRVVVEVFGLEPVPVAVAIPRRIEA